MIIGLIKPKFLLRKQKYARLKIFGLWLLFTFISAVIASQAEIHALSKMTPTELVQEYEKNHSLLAIDFLRKIPPEDSLYDKAQSMLREIESSKLTKKKEAKAPKTKEDGKPVETQLTVAAIIGEDIPTNMNKLIDYLMIRGNVDVGKQIFTNIWKNGWFESKIKVNGASVNPGGLVMMPNLVSGGLNEFVNNEGIFTVTMMVEGKAYEMQIKTGMQLKFKLQGDKAVILFDESYCKLKTE
jgi:hypothetical protein